VVQIHPPQPNLIDSQRLADSIQQAGFVFGEELGRKSVFPSAFSGQSGAEKFTKFLSGWCRIFPRRHP
jgi:hypothetical protein